MKKMYLLVFAMCMAMPQAFAAEPVKKETVAVEMKEVAPAAAPAPAAVVAPSVDDKAKIAAENEALIKAQEEKQLQEITEPPGWLKGAMMFAMKMPYIGPILVQILQWMGVVAALLTALASLLLAMMKIVAKFGRSAAFLSKVKDLLDKVYPWVAYLSMYNVAKKEEPKDKKVA